MERDEELKDFKTVVGETIDEIVKEKETTKAQHASDKELTNDDIIKFASRLKLSEFKNDGPWISLYDIINAVVSEKIKDLDKGDKKPSDVKQKLPLASGYYGVMYKIFNPDNSYYYYTALVRYYKETNLWKSYDKTVRSNKHEFVFWFYPDDTMKAMKKDKSKKKEKWIRDRYPKSPGYYKIQYRYVDDDKIILDTRIAYFMPAQTWCEATTLDNVTYKKDLYHVYYNSRVIGWKHINVYEKEETK